MKRLFLFALLIGCGPEIGTVEESEPELLPEVVNLERHRLRPMEWITMDGLRVPSVWLWDSVRRRACQVRPFGDVAICAPPELEITSANARDWEVMRLE